MRSRTEFTTCRFLTLAKLSAISDQNTQAFITTHSDEMIDAFARAAEELSFREIAALHFRRTRTQSTEVDAIRVKRCGYDDIRAAREINLELRQRWRRNQ
jgi:hypothetical protein